MARAISPRLEDEGVAPGHPLGLAADARLGLRGAHRALLGAAASRRSAGRRLAYAWRDPLAYAWRDPLAYAWRDPLAYAWRDPLAYAWA